MAFDAAIAASLGGRGASGAEEGEGKRLRK